MGLPVQAGPVFCAFAHLQVCLLHSEPTVGELWCPGVDSGAGEAVMVAPLVSKGWELQCIL